MKVEIMLCQGDDVRLIKSADGPPWELMLTEADKAQIDDWEALEIRIVPPRDDPDPFATLAQIRRIATVRCVTGEE